MIDYNVYYTCAKSNIIALILGVKKNFTGIHNGI